MPEMKAMQPPSKPSFFTRPTRLMVDDGSGKRLQLCPAIFVSDKSKLPDTVQYVYSRIAATAEDRIASGHPNLVLSLAGTGNSFNFQVVLLQRALSANYKSVSNLTPLTVPLRPPKGFEEV